MSNGRPPPAAPVTETITTANGEFRGIAVNNFGTITACWFNGIIAGYNRGNIASGNYSTITACYYGQNGGLGVATNNGTDDTNAIGTGASWQTAVDGMNPALTGNDYQWALGTDGLPLLQKKQ